MDVRLHYELTGAGRPIVIQGPAWGPSSDYLRLTLVPFLDGARVVTFDPRNVGRSSRIDAPDAQGVAHLVSDLEALRCELGLRRFVLIGHSHGGFVAMAYALRHGEHLDGLVLLNTTVRLGIGDDEREAILDSLGSDPKRREAVDLFRATGGRLRGIDGDLDLARQMRRLMPAYFFDLNAMQRFAALARGARPPSAAALERMPGDLEPWVELELAGIRAPTLIVTGAWDPATPPAAARHIGDLVDGAQVAVFKRSGHHPWVEEPEEFKRILDGFLIGPGRGRGEPG